MDIITIQNIHLYLIEFIDSQLILTPKKKYYTEKELEKINLKKSKIIKCILNNSVESIAKYKPLLLLIYSKITNIDLIIKNTLLNISTEEIYERGFDYYPDLKLSIQGAESKRTLFEIINMIKINKFHIDLQIQLKNNDIINFKI